MKITIEGQEFRFDGSMQNNDGSAYSRFAAIEDNLECVADGSCGGAFGTEQGFYEFRVSDDYTVRRVMPGHSDDGYLSLEEWPLSHQLEIEQRDRDEEAYYEQMQREHMAQIAN